ncbi:MAG: CPBP family intramembrane metalloprotease [Lachnospiraceae bacterium]|nr:CPBP family intramembrane metalloprotease [Lachnospiraceae bacterium]
MLNMQSTIGLILFTAWQIVLTCVAVFLMRKLHIFDISDFKFKNIGKGFLLGWLFIVLSVILFFLNFTQLPEDSLIKPNLLNLLIVVLHPFIGTGLLEEVLARGLILKILLKKMGYSKKGIINACIISSAIFGIIHIVNITHSDFLSVASQIIYATALGLLFAALYLRIKTLIVPILLHGFVNLSGQIFNAIALQPDTQPESDILAVIINTLLVSIPFIIVGFILLKKVKPDEIVTEKNFA